MKVLTITLFVIEKKSEVLIHYFGLHEGMGQIHQHTQRHRWGVPAASRHDIMDEYFMASKTTEVYSEVTKDIYSTLYTDIPMFSSKLQILMQGKRLIQICYNVNYDSIRVVVL